MRAIHRNNKLNKWEVTCRLDCKKVYIGVFSELDQTIDARDKFELDNPTYTDDKLDIELTQASIKDFMNYDALTGLCTYAKDYRAFHKKNSRKAGDIIGRIDYYGYVIASFYGKQYRLHRLIILWLNGSLPDEVDHINGIRSDNRLCNIRNTSPGNNARNKARPENNKSGVVGVYWHSQNGRWRADIRHEGKKIHLGDYHIFEKAVNARRAAEVEYGYHANHGRDKQKQVVNSPVRH